MRPLSKSGKMWQLDHRSLHSPKARVCEDSTTNTHVDENMLQEKSPESFSNFMVSGRNSE